jgi:hypothetical protein
MSSSSKRYDELNLERGRVTTSADSSALRECREEYATDFAEVLTRLSRLKHLFPVPERRTTFEGCEPFVL